MTAIEQETLVDGFRLCVMDVRLDRTTGRVAVRTEGYDGGRPAGAWTGTTCLRDADPAWCLALQSAITRVLAPPHVLVAAGRCWREVLFRLITPTLLARHRILDLRATAVALGSGLRPGSADAAIARAFGVSMIADREAFSGPPPAELLWAVLSEAGRRGLDWPGLLGAAAAARESPSFDRYAFGEAELDVLPEGTGVYAMRDASDSILYVGKTGNLRRRMAEYFRPTFAPDRKLQTLRARVRSLEFHPVGSELEAELIEDLWIRDRRPELNVQRRIEEGASRYTSGFRSVCMLEGSRHPGCMDLFAWAPGRSAVQLSIRPDRPPNTTLAALHAYLSGRSARCPRSTRLVDWGARGRELCVRHFGRRRPTANWLDPDGSATGAGFAAAVVRALKSLRLRGREPGEFRPLDDPGENPACAGAALW